MAPNSRWTPEKTEALLNALGKTLLKTATLAQKESIEGHMKDAGYDATWEAVRIDIANRWLSTGFLPKGACGTGTFSVAYGESHGVS
ncbi:hypothetical protein PGQ11_009257 [Apiospora arundinis]|uniref:Uncharacterized protein n=1 Tax=Apiospora arundinis TaxID=335852 RepID=A0ABR2II70_9PEZI